MTGAGDTVKPMRTSGLQLRRARPSRPPEPTAPGGPSADSLAAARGTPAGGEATALYDGKELPGVPRLVVTAGPRKGSEFALISPVTTIGRALENGICIPDVSMSRRHSRLERRGSAWLVLDEGSGNGTCVNGKAARRRKLLHGDEIAMGDTAVRFVEPFGVLVRADVTPPRRDPVLPISWLSGPAPLHLAVAIAALTILGALCIRQRRASALADAQARTEAARAVAQARFQEGMALVKQGLWIEGRDKLRVAAELAPETEKLRQLEVAESEVPRAEAIAAARAALRREDVAAVREALAAIPGDSALADEARILESALPPPASAETPVSAVGAVEPRPERREVQAILDAYRGGDVSTASRRARAARSAAGRQLAASIGRFAAAWTAGLAERQPAAAIPALEAAAELDRAIARGADGRIGRSIRKALAARHLALAAALSKDDELPRAAGHLRAAAQAEPANAEVEERLRQVSLRANEMYLRAYVAREDDPEQARRGFRTVAQSLPPDDELAQKARRWLSALERKGGQ